MISRIPVVTTSEALSTRTAHVAELGAPFFVNFAILLLRAAAIAGLASPGLLIWFIW